ncbi:TIGR03862 family flavoprotein [Frigidibacter sp. ROC022]|uniref:TIGR03862 family flavoprotein n=1 Tax=Frigidibacter sp. ROC022 TaxID=2971796 RepID=UPI00215AE0F0|nr:TIGR03862 family flavoprotein [Frigidibacter sp. ROC022]MCR8724942.1 TIGR03862 family flavoprotein [Frigidibacter sp. ROC022]
MDSTEVLPALVIGAGPAGLMAAETLSAAGHAVTLVEAKPSVGRKFLMAGKSGLNLTKDEPADVFAAQIAPAAPMAPILAAFGPSEAQDWARGLGQELFTGSTGRVFPRSMKASPLLRAWLARLAAQGVAFRTRWRWTGWDAARDWRFDTPEGARSLRPRVTVLALGGASWARLGSDGAWAAQLLARGVPVAPFRPANAGLTLNLTPHMDRFHGAALKNIALLCGDRRLRGELVLVASGLEGGALYALTPQLRDGATLALDLMPDLRAEALAARLGQPGKTSLPNRLRKAGLDPLRIALAQEFARPLPTDGAVLAALLKALPVPHQGPRPMDQAISTAGGIAWEGMTGALELKALPGTFAAGEMLDWEAPTGGYLITGCLATGLWAGRAAAARLG